MALPAGLALNDGLAVAGSGGGGGGDANNILGGAANEIVYQVGTDTTGFIPAPSVPDTFLQWDGAAFTWVGGSGGLTVGTTTVGGGTTTRVLFDNGGLLGEYAISGTGNVAMTTNPVFTTPNLGTPSSLTLTNATGLPMAGISGLDANVATWLGTPTSANLAAAVTNETGSGALVFATSPTLVTPALGTPSSVNLANGTNLPISGIASLGSNVGTWLATPSSANLASAVTDETGSGSLVFATSPTLVTPALGTPSAVNLANATNLPISAIASLGSGVGTWLATPSSANLASAVTDETGSGALVFANTPTLVTPVLGAATATSVAADTFTLSTSNVNAQSGTTYTLQSSDNGKTVICTNGSSIAVALDTGLTAGFWCRIVQGGAGQVTVGGTATSNSANGKKTRAQYSVLSIIYAGASNTYFIGGDTST